MGGFTSLMVGVSGLRSSQNAINATSHNLANVNTPGYVRQQPFFSDSSYKTVGRRSMSYDQIGIGVDLTAVRRIRDSLLDKAYRQENGRREFYEAQMKAIDEVEEVFGEMDGVKFQQYLEDLRYAVQEVVKEPTSQVKQALLVQSSDAFIRRANSIYHTLEEYQNTLNKQVQNQVNRINALGNKIHELNKKISRAEAGDVENANDLRDQRDNALDELSSMVSIRYNEDPASGIVTVKVEGVDFVSESNVYHMGTKMLDTDKDSVLLTPVWPYLKDNPVYNLTTKVSTKANNDIGSLRATLLARGNCTANYTDIPDASDYDGKDAAGNPDGTESAAYKRALKIAQYEGTALPNPADYVGGKNSNAYKKDLVTYQNEIEPSSIKTVMAEFDQLVNSIVESINDILCPNIDAASLQTKTGDTLIGQTYVDASGKTRTITKDTLFFDAENAGYGRGENSEVQGTELFVRDDVERYSKVNINGKDYMVFNDYGVFGAESLYTLGNISLNEEVLHDYTKIPLSTKDGGEDRARAEALGEAWNSASMKLTPDYNTQRSFMKYYTEFTGQIANAGNMYDNMINYQTDLTNGVNDERLSIMGVSDNEELTNLIKFQAAYNASSRYINVIDEMLEHLVTRL